MRVRCSLLLEEGGDALGPPCALCQRLLLRAELGLLPAPGHGWGGLLGVVFLRLLRLEGGKQEQTLLKDLRH